MVTQNLGSKEAAVRITLGVVLVVAGGLLILEYTTPAAFLATVALEIWGVFNLRTGLTQQCPIYRKATRRAEKLSEIEYAD